MGLAPRLRYGHGDQAPVNYAGRAVGLAARAYPSSSTSLAHASLTEPVTPPYPLALLHSVVEGPS